MAALKNRIIAGQKFPRKKNTPVSALKRKHSGSKSIYNFPGEFYKHILENIDEGILVMDENDRIIFANDPMAKIAGIAKEQIVGTAVLKDFPETTLKDFRSYYLEAKKSLRTVSFDSIFVMTPAGRLTYQSGILVPLVKNGRFDGMICTIIDITERKLAHDAIEKRFAALMQPLESGSVNFEDLFDIKEIQNIQDDFARAMGVAAIITNPDGAPITAPSNFTCICRDFVRRNEEGRRQCEYLNAAVGRSNPTGPLMQTCPNLGLWHAGASIMVGGRHVASWLIGQVGFKTQTKNKIRTYARKLGADEESFIRAFCEVPVMPKAKFEHIARALFSYANLLSKIAYQNVQQARFITFKKKTEDTLLLTQFAMDRAPDSILLVGEEGDIIYANDTACSSMGYAREELQGKKIFEIDPEFPISGWEQHKQDLKRLGRMTFEGCHRKKDGGVFPVEVTTNYFEYQGRFVAVAFDRDITSRKSLEEQLKLSEKKYRNIFENIPIGIYHTSPDGRFFDVNPYVAKILGYDSPAELIAAITDITKQLYFNPEDRKEIMRLFHEQGYIKNLETRLRKKNGDIIWASLNANAQKDNKGNIIFYEGILEDISKRKQAEEALQRRIVALTKPLEDNSIVFEDLFDINEIQRLQDDFARATGVAALMTHPDGTAITAPSNFTYLCGDFIRKNEKGRRRCEKSDAFIGRFHPSGPVVRPCLSAGLWNAGTSVTVGGRHIANWLIGQVRDETQKEEKLRTYARKLDVDEELFIREFYKVPVMPKKRFEQVAQALFTLANQLSRTAYQNVQQARFIADRREAEEALKESEDKFRNIFEGSNDAIMLLNKSGFIDCNNRTLEMFGLKSKEDFRRFTPAGLSPLFQPDGQDSLSSSLNKMQTAFETGINQFEWMHRRTDGKDFPAEVLLSSFSYGGEIILQATVRDISFRKQEEEEQVKISKLEAVGTLAGGIAHDFNNLLTAIQGYIELIKLDMSPESEAHRKLAIVEKSVNQATELTSRLIVFSKGGEPIKKITSPANIIREAALKNTEKSGVEIKIQIDENLWPVEIDERQIRQAISNIVVNACEAMPEGGTLTVGAENTTVTAQNNLPVNTGNYIVISITDTGTGIAADVLPQIFDIYFSTKQRGTQKGMGLGLSVCHSIINKHNGCITVESAEGKGSSFHIYLPAVIDREILSAAGRSTIPRRILVMDDDPAIRIMITELLTALKYDVDTTDNGLSAVDKYKKALESGNPYQIVILALKVTGGSGAKQTLDTLRAVNSGIRCILISGYTDDPVLHNYRRYGFSGILKKPFTLHALQNALNACLQGNTEKHTRPGKE